MSISSDRPCVGESPHTRSFSAAPRFPSNSSQDDKLMLLAVSGEHNAHDKYTEKETTHDK
jgi:hypothetical protein